MVDEDMSSGPTCGRRSRDLDYFMLHISDRKLKVKATVFGLTKMCRGNSFVTHSRAPLNLGWWKLWLFAPPVGLLLTPMFASGGMDF